MKERLILTVMGVLCAISACSIRANSLSDYGAVPAVAKPPQDQNDANEKLDFHTDPFTGRFSYSIPIDVPPARGGNEPAIALQYNSANKNGWCGVGWELEMGSIVRDTRHGVPISGASYADTDGFTFSIAGQSGRLISLGSGNYAPQIDTGFLKFVYSNGSWTITDKSGRQYNFGEASSSRLTTSYGTFAWGLSSIYDPNGNQTVLTYVNKSQLLLKEIDYNGNINNPTLATSCSVMFDLSNRTDVVSSLISGSEIVTSNLLGSIRVFSQGQFVRRYQLQYATSPSTGRSLIQKVTEYGSDNATALPVHSFSYSLQAASFQPTNAWFMTPQNYNDASGYAPATPNSQLVDMNGDGLPDWVTETNLGGIYQFNVQLNSGNGFNGGTYGLSPLLNEGGDGTPTWNTIDSATYVGSTLTSDCMLLDMNGDLIPDRVMRAYTVPGNHFQVQLNSVTSGFSSLQNWTGVSASAPDNDYAAPQASIYNRGLNADADQIAILADMNGDGLPDRVLEGSSGTFKVQLNSANAIFGSPITWNGVNSAGPIPYAPRASDTLHVYSELMDMNGDGLPDRVLANGVQLNNGVNGFSTLQGWNYSGDPEAVDVVDGCYTTQFIDMNGDGLPDKVVSGGSGNYTVYFNTGRGFSSTGVTWSGVNTGSSDGTTGWNNLQAWDAYGSKIVFADVNGDGLPDRIKRQAAAGGVYYFLVQLNTGPYPDLMITASNGIGGSVAITYASSTTFNNSDGSRPRLPFPVYAVTSVTTTDGHGNSGTSGYKTSYGYASGLYDTTYREFRGFGFVTQTNPSGSYTLTWFHQGGGTNGAALGEYNDDLSKAGMPYRIESYGTDKKLYTRTINTVGEVEVNNSGVFFPFVSQTIKQDYEANSGYRATAQGFAYNAIANNLSASTGNLVEETNYGEVGSVNIAAHSFTALNTVPEVYTLYTYATIPSNPNIIDHLASVTVSGDSAGSTVLKQTTSTYFDVTGNLQTKNDLICPGTYATTTYGYDNYGNVTSATDPVSVVTTTSYDPAMATYPVLKYTGILTNGYQYDTRSGAILYQTNEQGMVTENVYDVFFRPTNTFVSVTANGAPTLLRVKYQYVLGGLPSANSSNYVHISKNDPADTTAGFHESYTFMDGMLRPIQTREEAEISGDYRVSNIAYDPCGGVTLQEYPFLDTGGTYKKYTTARTNAYTEYDPIDRPFRVNPVATSGQNSSGWWNGNNPTVSTGDASSPVGPMSMAFKDGTANPWAIIVTNALKQIHKYYLDAYGRTNQIVEVTSQGNFTSSLGYSSVGDLTNITDNANNQISFFYDLLGREVAVADPDMGFWQYGLDAAGRLKVQTDAKGQQIKFFYNDAAGRLTRREGWNTAGQLVSICTYTYDSNGGDSSYTVYPGQTFEVTDDEGWQKSSYDVRDRTLKTVRYLSKNGNTYTNLFTFDNADRMVQQAYPNNGPTITNIFDLGENLSQVKQVGGSGTVYYAVNGFNGMGQLLGVNFGNGIKTTNTYYLLSRRLNKITSAKTANIQSLTYTFDAIGNVSNIVDGVYTGTNSDTCGKIAYDDLNRLTSLTNTAGSFSYAFDSVGNMLSNGEFGSGVYSYGTGGIRPHSVRTANGNTYTYDQNGNVVYRNRQRLIYDVNNRLAQVVATNGVVTTFGYDASGARLWKSTSTNTLQVWIDGNYEEKNGKILFHILADGRTVCTFDSTGTVFEYYHDDLLTSTAIQSDQNGNEIQNLGYTAFGKTRNTQSSSVFPVSRRFTGQDLDDDTGLYYYNFRYYDPQLGRFTQPDNIIADFGDPQSYNRYTYVRNNPLRYTDPTGHLWKWTYNWVPKSWARVLGAPGEEVPKPPPNPNSWMQMQSGGEDGIGGYDGTALHTAGHVIQGIGENATILPSIYNNGYTAVTGDEAHDYHKVGTGERVQAIGATAAVVFPMISKTAAATGTVWDAIRATQPVWEGTVIPRSFELATESGNIWVHGNATEHLAEYATSMMNRGVSKDLVNMASQAQLQSLQAAVSSVTSQGIEYGKLIKVGGWELKFAAPRQAGQLPALIHAQPIP